ncbi:hypothetical protein C8Q74DRAFT_658190 [Fomes fomentarius]|nr:hypothetical protein C8Q74DRAFT_658190 [Fomes fomentarius]
MAALFPPPFVKIPPLDNTYGAILMGSNISLILYGFNIHQAYRYVRQFPNDSRFVKSIVWITLALESMNSAFCMYISYHHLITYYFNPIELQYASFALDSMPLAAGLSIITSQCFFVRRVYKLGGTMRWIACTGVFMLIVEFVFCLVASVEAFVQPSFQAYQSVTWLISAGFASIVFTDGILTSSLIIALRRSRTGYKSTDSLIDLIVLYAITTGLLTAIVNLVSFFLALILPDNLIYVGVNVVAGKLYVTSLFAALNSRIGLAKHAAATTIYGTGAVTQSAKSHLGPEMTWRVAEQMTTTDSSGIDVSTVNLSNKAPELQCSVGMAGINGSVNDAEMRPVAFPV